MRAKSFFILTVLAAVACGASARRAEAGTTIPISPGETVQEDLQEALILAEPGTTIELAAGTYHFTRSLSLDVDTVTVRGAGPAATVLSFKGQDAGSEGLLVTSSGVTLEGFAIEDTKGDAIKVKGATGITLRNLRTEWTAGPLEINGAYGLYPVQSENVLIEHCVAIGASDAGIYVGQSKNIIIRHCRAEYNVAGIEIENSHGADVYENVVTNNTGGILVFDLPDLPVQGGRDVRVFDNRIVKNNHPNFAPAGNIVAGVPPGTGIMLMANDNVEIFGNTVSHNQTANLSIISYLSSGNEIHDPDYDPFPERIHVHDNIFSDSGAQPGGDLGLLAAQVLGAPLPDIVWDGVINPAKAVDGRLPEDLRIYIHDNGDATFGSFDAAGLARGPEHVRPNRDLAAHAGAHPSLAPVVIPGAG